MRPLDGIVILDLTRFLPGAVATMSLATFGAEVIKVEQPGTGDPGRDIEESGCLFAETNSGKKSIAIDLKDARGRNLFYRLAAKADVVIESFRPGVMSRLEIDYGHLRAINPGLIFASLTGYGHEGSNADLAGHDINYMAMSGLLDLMSSSDGSPVLPEIQIADLAGGSTQLVVGILLALQARQKTGRGQTVNVCMVNGMGNLLPVPLAIMRGGRRCLSRGNELLSGAYACYHLYQASDGRWLAVGALEPQFWANLCHRLGQATLIEDQFAPDPRQSEIKGQLAQVFASNTAEHWVAMLHDHDCCVTLVRSLREALADGYFDPRNPAVALSETPAQHRCDGPPTIGEHSLEILLQLGVSESELCVLQNDRVIQSTSRQALPAKEHVRER